MYTYMYVNVQCTYLFIYERQRVLETSQKLIRENVREHEETIDHNEPRDFTDKVPFLPIKVSYQVDLKVTIKQSTLIYLSPEKFTLKIS